MSARAPERGRRRVFRRAMIGAGFVVLFASTLVGGVLVHLPLAPGRRLVGRAITNVLETTFYGRIVIDKIGSVGPDGVDGVEATVYDPDGSRVLHVLGLRAEASPLAVALTVVTRKNIHIEVRRARIEQVDAFMLPDRDGVPSIARAFTPRPSTSLGRVSAPPEISVWLPEVELRTACVRGTVTGLGDLDVDLANVSGSVLAGTARTSIRVKRYSMSLVAPARAQGTADTRIEIPSATGQSLSIWGAFDGYVGDVQINARGSVDGSELDVTGDVVRARPEAVRALWPVWPLLDDASLHVQSSGRLPILVTHGNATVGAGTAEFSGELGFQGQTSLNLDVDARGVDLRSLVSGAPEATVSASGHLGLALTPAQGVSGSIDAKTEAFTVEGIDVPPAAIVAKVEGARVAGTAKVRDATMSSDVEFDLHPQNKDGPLALDVVWSARVPEISRVPWLSPVGSGQARWQAKGQIANGQLDARAEGTIERFTRPGLRLEEARVSGSLRGPFDHLRLAASLDGNSLVAGPLYFPEVKASAEGPLTRLAVTTTVFGGTAPKLTANAIVQPAPGGAGIRDLEIVAERGDVVISAKVRSIEVSEERVDLTDVEVAGAGSDIVGSISMSPTQLRVRMSTTDVDLKKLAAIVAPGFPIAGRVGFDVDAELAGKHERGHARLQLTDASIAGFSNVSAQAEVDVEGNRFSGGAELRVGDLGSLSARTVNAGLAGPLLQASSWNNASGSLQVDAQVDLDHLRHTVGSLVPSIETGGTAYARLLVAREEVEAHQKHAPTETEAPPDIDLLIWTDRLRVEPRSAAVASLSAPPRWLVEGVDMQLGMHLEGERQHAEVTARLIDGQGLLAALTVIGNVPVRDLWQHPEQRVDRILRLPLTANLTLPRRGVSTYPEIVHPVELLGDVEAAGVLTGSIRSPAVALRIRGYGIQPDSGGLAFPVDVEADASYDGRKGSARLLAKRPQGIVLDAVTDVDAPLEALFAPTGPKKMRWEASGSAKLFNFPLASVAALSGSQVGGVASGTLTFRGINRDPEVGGQLEFKDLKIDRAVFPQGVAFLRIAKGGVVATTRLEQASGGVSATANARVKWTSPVLPEIDSGQPLDVFVDARDFRAATLYPLLLKGIFTYFDGRLDGTLHLHQEMAKSEVAQTLDGAFDLREGSFQIPEVGQEFRNATAKILVTQGGEVDISKVSANGVSGRLTASGKMTMKGLSFVSAEGEVRIAKNEAVPITVEGVSLGEAWGTLFLHAKRPDERTIKLDVDVPVLYTDLPESSGRDLQSLGDHPDIRVGIRSKTGEFPTVLLGPPKQKRSDEALVWRITFYLGQDVHLRRGGNLELVLGGKPAVELTDQARVTGQVDFVSGKVEVFGKRFEIEHGSAKFQGDDSSNPYVSVTARWEAPDGTRIFADFVGPLRTGALTLRSEPARSQNEILAILLYGGDENVGPGPGPNYQQQDEAASAGAVIAGGAVTTGVNRVLSRVTPLDITTRVTNDSQNPTPEVAIQLSPKLTAQISYRTRPPRFGENPARTFLTLDWRFKRNWSVATTVADQTSVVDLIWRYRY